MKLRVWPTCRVWLIGEMAIEMGIAGAFRLILAAEDFVGSATEVAVRVTEKDEEIMEGAV